MTVARFGLSVQVRPVRFLFKRVRKRRDGESKQLTASRKVAYM